MKAEAARIAEEERKKVEAARIAEKERKKAEAARIAEKKRKQAEAARIAEKKRQQAEAARIAEKERKKAEAARIAQDEKAEKARLAVEKKKRQKAAAVRPAAAEEERKKTAAASLPAGDKTGNATPPKTAARSGKSKTSQQEVAKVARQKRAKVKVAGPSGCGSVAALDITGYKNNRAELPQGAAGQLAVVAKSLKGTRCRIRITGHASNKERRRVPTLLFQARTEEVAAEPRGLGITADPLGFSVGRMSRARAAAVARELRRLGVAADQISTGAAIGGGQRVSVRVQQLR